MAYTKDDRDCFIREPEPAINAAVSANEVSTNQNSHSVVTGNVISSTGSADSSVMLIVVTVCIVVIALSLLVLIFIATRNKRKDQEVEYVSVSTVPEETKPTEE